MKYFPKLAKFTAVIFLCVGFTSCSDDDEGTPPVIETNTIAHFVTFNEDYSSLAAALEVTGLTSTLDGAENYTVFAPDNDAFLAFLSENGFSTLSEVPIEMLTQDLMNHVQSGEIMAADLSTLAEDSFTINLGDGAMITDANRRTANIIAVDVQANNGVIQVLDTILLPTM